LAAPPWISLPELKLRRRLQVALLIETSNSYGRGLLDGVIAYVRDHESWSIYLPEQRRGERPPDWLRRWSGDGIIARIENREIASAVKRTRLPAIDVSAARTLPEIPWVETDDEVIARLAVEHLVERGFRRLAFCGDPRFNWSNWRCEHFRRLADEAGCTTWVYQSPVSAKHSVSWHREHERLAAWIKSLPRPVGVMACYDIKAQQPLDVCRNLGVAVPEEMAVIGVDNDPVICELCMPPLSSVNPDARRTGYIAAELLDQMMRGTKVATITHLVKPLGICTRRSTDVLAMEDPDVAAALRFIREYACDGIQVGDVVREVPLSRRVLESRFVKLLGRTPHEEILSVKLDRVRRLLRETDLPIKAIAARTGFSNEDYMSVAFKRAEGLPPSEFRLRQRSPARPARV
jgi:LacI family transcriptional regulator